MEPTPASTPPSAPRPGAPSRPEVIGAGVTWLSRWTLRWLVVAAGAVVLWWLAGILWPIVLPVLLALLLAAVLEPLSRAMHRRLGVPRTISALTALLALGLVVGIGSWQIAPPIGDQLVALADNLSDALDEVEQWLMRQDQFQVTREQVESAVDAAQERLRSSAASIASGVLVGISAITSALVTTATTVVLTFFFLRDGHRFLPWLGRRAGAPVGRHLSEVARRSWHVLGGFIRAQAMVGLIDAVLIGAGLLVLGVPLALPLAVLTFVAAFAPIVGAITVGALAVLVALVAEGWITALLVALVVVVVQQLEGNVFLPWIQGKNLRLHAAVVLVAIILGAALFGVAGAFLAVPVTAVAAVVLRYLDEQVSERSADSAPPGGAPPAGPA
jgi:predicted PurR-regulated permease PerM